MKRPVGSLRVGKPRVGILTPNMSIQGGLSASPPWSLLGVAGVINMLASSKAFENAVWLKTNIFDTTFATKTTAPDGTNTAEKFIANTTSGSHGVTITTITKSASSNTYRYMVDAKAEEYTRIAILADDNGTNFAYVGFDLAGGQKAYGPTTFGTGFSATNVTITPIGNGFYRCAFDATTNTATSLRMDINLDNGTGTAAESRSFIGNSANGAYIWQASLLPTAAWMLATQVFNDDFGSGSTIDTGNTKAAGFNWYMGQPWPNANGAPGNAWITNSLTQTPTTQPGNTISVTGSILTISNDAGGFGNDLATVAWNGSKAIGTTFKPPFYSEFSMSFDVSQAANGKSWPTGFMIAREMLDGTIATSNLFGEIDIVEPIPSGVGTVNDTESFHDWTLASVSTANSTDFTIPIGVTYANQNKFGRLLLTQGATGGRGLTQIYVNGVYLSGTEITYATATGAIPNAAPVNATAIFVDMESQHFPFMLAAGTSNWAGNFDFVRVYAIDNTYKITS